MIVDANITVRFLRPRAPTYVVEDRKKKGGKQISQRKEKIKKRLNQE
ncbi:MAG: hypothetical protein ACMUEL_04265 [Flavobacteriales bacterium Tduv]